MAERLHHARDKSLERVVAIVHELLRDYHPRDFAIEFWDGSRWDPEQGSFCRFTWHVHTPAALRTLLRSDRQVAFGEAYIYDDFDISGDILAIFPVAEYLRGRHISTAEKLRLGSLLLGLPGKPHEGEPMPRLHGLRHTKTRDQDAVSFHYDLSNDFYKLWLDDALVYSCAYFNSPDDSLDRAQTQKLDYICRKLRLKPGEHLLDIGCGWGGLIMHAARHYGVHTTGITVSEQQRALAKERIVENGLSATCEIHLLDYRDATTLGQFDKLVSVGMIEHVGESKLTDYFRAAFQLLKPGGVFLNHGIGRAGNRDEPAQPTFTDVHVFPDAELVPISRVLRSAEQIGFEVRDVENLREHYFLTLCHWLRRLEASADAAKEMVGEIRYRICRLYLAGSAHYFQSGKLGVYQSLLTKNIGGQSTLPLTRNDWYR